MDWGPWSWKFVNLTENPPAWGRGGPGRDQAMTLFPMLVFHFMGQRRGQKGVTGFSLALKTFPSLSSGLCFGFPLSVTNDFPGRITLPLCQVPPSPVACEIQPLSRNSLIFSTIFLLPSFVFFFFFPLTKFNGTSEFHSALLLQSSLLWLLCASQSRLILCGSLSTSGSRREVGLTH